MTSYLKDCIMVVHSSNTLIIYCVLKGERQTGGGRVNIQATLSQEKDLEVSLCIPLTCYLWVVLGHEVRNVSHGSSVIVNAGVDNWG